MSDKTITESESSVTYTPPAVHTGIAAILASLSVAKGGTLPSNMGGKDYIKADDLSSEIKRKFVDNKLIHFPREKVTKHEVIVNKDRLNVTVVIEGEYKIVSLVDGSTETISGAGDGLASGSAVASNIASTNALKNALLRFFLVTEQSVEDAGKKGVSESEQGPNRAQQRIATATEGQVAPSVRPTGGSVSTLQNQIRDAGKAKGLDYLAVGTKHLGIPQPQWVNDAEKLQQVLNHITDLPAPK